MFRRFLFTVIACAVSLAAFGAPPSGAAIYKQRCAACHDGGSERMPSRRELATRAPKDIIRALTSGTMKVQANGLGESGIRAVAEFLTVKKTATKPVPAKATTPPKPAPAAAPSNQCKTNSGTLDLNAVGWNGWGHDPANSRFQPQPGLRAEDVSRLKLKWAFGYPGKGVRGQPTVVGGRLFVAGPAGHVYSLDAATGCTYWTHEAKGNVRSAISIGALPEGSAAKFAAYFGDDKGFVHAVDALTGAPLWKVAADPLAGTLITGAPTLYDGRLYVPVSSSEEKLAGFLPKYACCKFRGSILALDAATGKQIWKTYTLADDAKPFRKGKDGRDIYGPAGAAVWSAPTIDVKRRRVYAVTGNSYTDADAPTFDAILALDLDTGTLLWAQQKTKNDNYLLNCGNDGHSNCPDVAGDDFDFGATPILHTLADGRQVLLAGQKSGTIFALDPEKGDELWRERMSPGGLLGGIQWGPGADRENVYVAISDVVTAKGGAAPGLYAFDIATGKRKWSTPAPEPECRWGTNGCSHAQSAAVSVIPGVVFSGSLDGHLRAYASGDGAILWDVETAGPYETVNGLPANGGSLDTGGAVVVNGTLYVNSGYALVAGRPGNVLLAFSVDGK